MPQLAPAAIVGIVSTAVAAAGTATSAALTIKGQNRARARAREQKAEQEKMIVEEKRKQLELQQNIDAEEGRERSNERRDNARARQKRAILGAKGLQDMKGGTPLGLVGTPKLANKTLLGR